MSFDTADEVFAEVSAYLKETYDDVDIYVSPYHPHKIGVRSSAVSPDTDGAQAASILCGELTSLLHAITGEPTQTIDFGGEWDSRCVENSKVAVEVEEMPAKKTLSSHHTMYVMMIVTEPYDNTLKNEATDKKTVLSNTKEMWEEFVIQLGETFEPENVKEGSLMYQDRCQLNTEMSTPELATVLKGLMHVITGDKPKVIAPHGYKKFPYHGATWKVRCSRVELSFYGIHDAKVQKPTRAYVLVMFPRFNDDEHQP